MGYAAEGSRVSSPHHPFHQPGARFPCRIPDYFHKVVDCQWACPAHTPVPEYIRLIAAGRYSDAYMVNWASNVFPGILGRTCDRPCEPACRRGRVEEENVGKPEPVAICRLKRVAADSRTTSAPPAPAPAQATASAWPASAPARPRSRSPATWHRSATASPSSTRDPKAGGFIRTQIPRFRLPEEVIDEETGYILDLGVEFRGGRAHRLPRGAARGRLRRRVRRLRRAARPRPRLPGRAEAAKHIHIGIDWLASVSFGHIEKVGRRVIVLGGGNTAMDCCRTARRLGGEDVKVIVRSGFDEMKASPWEKEDAMHEGIPILNFLVPKAFEHENGRSPA
jgi:formate dehydrogenase (NADP+) beta subunit